MKEFGKIVSKSLLLTIVFIACFFSLREIFYNHEAETGKSFHALPLNSLDIIALGSSHAQYSFDPALIYKDSGLYAYNLGSACQPLEVSLQMLKEAFKTQKPKMVFLEMFTALPLQKMCQADSNYIMAAYLMRGKERLKTFSYLPEAKRNLYFNDFLIYHNDWRSINNLNYFTSFRNEPIKEKDIAGNFGYLENKPSEQYSNFWPVPLVEVQEEKQLLPKDLNSLNAILKLCQANNIELVLYKTPIDSFDSLNQAYLEAFKRWANKHKVTVFDFLNNCLKYDFFINVHSDSFHAYNSGANIISSELASYINKKKSHFKHKFNVLLDNKLKTSSIYSVSKILNSEKDYKKILRCLKEAKGYTLLTYQANNYNDTFLTLLKDFSKGKLKENKNYNCLFKDGKLISILKEEDTFDKHQFKIEEKKVTIDSKQYELKDTLQIHYFDDDFNLKGTFMCNPDYRVGYYGGYPYENFNN